MKAFFATIFLAALASQINATEVDLRSTTLPIVIINTSDQSIPDEPKITGRMQIIASGDGGRNYLTDPANEYVGWIGIEIRGQSSQSFPKKQYSLETRDAHGENRNVPLLGMPAENDWVLYAPFSDKTLLRNFLAYRIAELTGHYAPRTRFCELVLNGRYEGLYIFVEKIKRDGGRVDISRASTNNLTGGYLIEKTSWDKIEDEDIFIVTEQTEQPFVIKYPKNDKLTPAHLDWIAEYINDCEDAIYGPDFQNPASGYAAYLDIPSLVDFLLVNEVFRNPDVFWASTFLHKDREGKLFMGPVWDFNIAMGNNQCNSIHHPPQGWTLSGGMWVSRLLTDPNLVALIQTRYQELRKTILSPEHLDSLIEGWVVQIEEAQARNFIRWNILNQLIWPNCHVGQSHHAEVDLLQTWLHERISWLDSQWGFAEERSPVINEINYNSCADFSPGDWLEIYNPWYEDIDLSSWSLNQNGFNIASFGAGTWLNAGQYLIVAADPNTFVAQFPGVAVANCCTGFELNDLGAELSLSSPHELPMFSVTYDSEDPWPAAAAGQCSSLELLDPFNVETGATNWRASLEHGTPGQVNRTIYRKFDTSVVLTATSPNPFYFTTTVEFTLERDALVELAIFDIRGRHLVTLFKGELSMGPQIITWNGKDLSGNRTAAGMYICRLECGTTVINRKLTLIK